MSIIAIVTTALVLIVGFLFYTISKNSNHTNSPNNSIVQHTKTKKSITAKDVKKSLKVEFVGYDGFGQVKITSDKYDNVDFTIENNGRLRNGDDIILNMADVPTLKSNEKFTGSGAVTYKISGLVDLKAIKNIDELVQLNDDFANNENKSVPEANIKNTLEKVHTYAFSGDADGKAVSGVMGGSTDDVDDENSYSNTVTINQDVNVPTLSIFTVYKVTTDYGYGDVKNQYKAYGLQGLIDKDNNVDISAKSTDTDGVDDGTGDTLPIIEKRLEKNAIIIK